MVVFGVGPLSAVIFLFNKFQRKLRVHRLFYCSVIASGLIFSCLSFVFNEGNLWSAYPLYIWKEIYIVLLVHLLFGYLTNSMSYKLAKAFYGPIGALSSLGGVAGGAITASLTNNFSTLEILNFGIFPIVLSAVFFSRTDKSININDLEKNETDKQQGPLLSIKSVKKYVFLIGGLIAISQFFTNLANFKFNILFEQAVTTQIDKTSYLGKLYSLINLVSFVVQIILIPLMLKYLRLKWVHYFIPLFYLFVSVICFGFASGAIIFVASAFVIIKGFDYSLFSTAKELLYFPLSPSQKYGAKYINDIVIYRFAKGLISLVLIFLQEEFIITLMMYGCLLLWIITLIIFIKEKTRFKEESY